MTGHRLVAFGKEAISEHDDVRVFLWVQRTAIHAPTAGGHQRDLKALLKGNGHGRLAVNDGVFSKQDAFSGGTRHDGPLLLPHDLNTCSAFIFLLAGGPEFV